MRIDDGQLDQKLSLDITPLIDIVFLLVLFFAVSTSFISGADLQQLKTDVITLAETKDLLERDISRKSSDLDSMQLLLQQREQDNSSLQQELDGSNQRLNLLDLQLVRLKSEAEAAAEKRQLLNSLLAEQTARNQQLASEQTALEDEKSGLASQLLLLQGLLSDRDSTIEEQEALQADTKVQLSDLEATVSKLNQALAAKEEALSQSQNALQNKTAEEVLLQKLIAEKAAELTGLQVQLTTANQARELAESAHQQASADAQKSFEQMRFETQAANTKVLHLQSELEKYRALIALDQNEIEMALRAHQELSEGMADYLANNSIGIERDQQKLTLQLSNKILFPSGSPQIKAEGLNVLRDLGEILNKGVSQMEIQIGGHTDNIPVANERGGNNWSLSAARAVNVVKFFQQELGVDPARLVAVGYGEHRPVADNNSAEGRAQNRRIEIVLAPR